MNTTLKSRWLVDAGLLFLFIATFFLDITGVSLHQWIGVAVGVIVVYHLISHWAWVKSVTLRFFGKTSSRSRIYYLLDASLLMGLLTIIGTGLVISTWLNLSLVAYTAWHFVHIAASLITLLAIVLKVGLHWRWIASVARNIFTHPGLQPAWSDRAGFHLNRKTCRAARVQPRDGSCRYQHRCCLQSRVSAACSRRNPPPQAPPATHPTPRTCPPACSMVRKPLPPTAGRYAATTGAHIPGHCRRYTDLNNNGRCDLGESA